MFSLTGILCLVVAVAAARLIWRHKTKTAQERSKAKDVSVMEDSAQPQIEGSDGISAEKLQDTAPTGMTVDDEELLHDLNWDDLMSENAAGDGNADGASASVERGRGTLADSAADYADGTDTFLVDIRDGGQPILVMKLHEEDGLVLMHRDDAPPSEVTVCASASDPDIYEITVDGALVAKVMAPGGLKAADVDFVAYAQVASLLAGRAA